MRGLFVAPAAEMVMDALKAPRNGGKTAGFTETATWRDGVSPLAGDTLSQAWSLEAVQLSVPVPLLAMLSSPLRFPEHTRVLPPMAGVQKKKPAGLTAIVDSEPRP